jgi:hypothetical protein
MKSMTIKMVAGRDSTLCLHGFAELDTTIVAVGAGVLRAARFMGFCRSPPTLANAADAAGSRGTLFLVPQVLALPKRTAAR